jgi:uncharacterized protein YndB with AHSA1/START domain
MSTNVRIEGDKLILTRVFAAPRAAVFEAWVETSKVQQWWGCAEATKVRSEIEPRVGGRYDHHMTIAGVGEVPSCGRITAFDPPARLAYACEIPPGACPHAGKTMTVTVDFVEVAGGTEVRLVHAGIPAEHRDVVRAGWTAAMEKLARLLATEAPAREARPAKRS